MSYLIQYVSDMAFLNLSNFKRGTSQYNEKRNNRGN